MIRKKNSSIISVAIISTFSEAVAGKKHIILTYYLLPWILEVTEMNSFKINFQKRVTIEGTIQARLEVH